MKSLMGLGQVLICEKRTNKIVGKVIKLEKTILKIKLDGEGIKQINLKLFCKKFKILVDIETTGLKG